MRNLLLLAALLVLDCPAAHAWAEKDLPPSYPLPIQMIVRPTLTLLAIPGGAAAGARCVMKSDSDSTNDHIKLTPLAIPRVAAGAAIGMVVGPLFTASTGVPVH